MEFENEKELKKCIFEYSHLFYDKTFYKNNISLNDIIELFPISYQDIIFINNNIPTNMNINIKQRINLLRLLRNLYNKFNENNIDKNMLIKFLLCFSNNIIHCLFYLHNCDGYNKNNEVINIENYDIITDFIQNIIGSKLISSYIDKEINNLLDDDKIILNILLRLIILYILLPIRCYKYTNKYINILINKLPKYITKYIININKSNELDKLLNQDTYTYNRCSQLFLYNNIFYIILNNTPDSNNDICQEINKNEVINRINKIN